MSMTDDHRVLYKKQNTDKFIIDRWNEIDSKSVDIARTSSSYVGGEGWEHPLVSPEFLGLYVAEGSFNSVVKNGNYKVIVTQSKKENHDTVKSILDTTGLKYNYSVNGDFQLTNKELHSFVSVLGKAKDKHFPRDFLDSATYDQLDAAFKSYAMGDGHWQTETSCTLVTTSPQLKDDLCEIGIKLGYKVQYKKYVSDNINHNDKYVVYFTLNSTTTRVDKGDIRNDCVYEPYTGKVYCIGVEDTENFVLRQKGTVWVSSNTTNPGGPGHVWVKKMFIDPAPVNTAFDARDMDTGEVLVFPETYPANHPTLAGQPHPMAGKPLYKRRFIPATLYDNPYLSNDGKYEANLLGMPEHQRRQLLEGDWSLVDGAAFPDFRLSTHTMPAYDIPKSWTKFRSCDYGFSSNAAVLWFAIDPVFNTLIVYRELYVKQHTGPQLAQAINQIEAQAGERMSYGVLDSSVWHNRGQIGPSIAEEMINYGCKWRPSDRSAGSRSAGFNVVQKLLQVDKASGKPGLIIFDNCRQLITDLSSIPVSPKGIDDIDDKYASDHTYDALRYGVMSRPKSVYSFEYSPETYRPSYAPVDSTFGY